MVEILYFEHLLLAVDLANETRKFELSQAEIGYATEGQSTDWHDAAYEQAHRDFFLSASKFKNAKETFLKYREIIRPCKRIPTISRVQVGAKVIMNSVRTDTYLIGGYGEIEEQDKPYQGRISIETPLIQEIEGKEVGYRFTFHGRVYTLSGISWGVPDYLNWYLQKYFEDSLGDLRYLKGSEIKKRKISQVTVNLANVIDRFRFLEMVVDSYPIVDVSFRKNPRNFIDKYERMLEKMKINYKPFN